MTLSPHHFSLLSFQSPEAALVSEIRGEQHEEAADTENSLAHRVQHYEADGLEAPAGSGYAVHHGTDCHGSSVRRGKWGEVIPFHFLLFPLPFIDFLHHDKTAGGQKHMAPPGGATGRRLDSFCPFLVSY